MAFVLTLNGAQKLLSSTIQQPRPQLQKHQHQQVCQDKQRQGRHYNHHQQQYANTVNLLQQQRHHHSHHITTIITIVMTTLLGFCIKGKR